MSYLARHRPICAALQEVRDTTTDQSIIPIIDEAIGYARRMSARLTEHKVNMNDTDRFIREIIDLLKDDDNKQRFNEVIPVKTSFLRDLLIHLRGLKRKH